MIVSFLFSFGRRELSLEQYIQEYTTISINVVGQSSRQDCMVTWVFINKFTKIVPNSGYSSPLQKKDHIDKCLWYFHPSHGNDNRKITAESQDVQLLMLTFGLVAYARGFKIRQR